MGRDVETESNCSMGVELLPLRPKTWRRATVGY